jgi:hypothetical protein
LGSPLFLLVKPGEEERKNRVRDRDFERDFYVAAEK